MKTSCTRAFEKALCLYYQRAVEEVIEARYGQLIKTNDYKPVVVISGLEDRMVRQLYGSPVSFTFITGTIDMGGIKAIFEVDMDRRNFTTLKEEISLR